MRFNIILSVFKNIKKKKETKRVTIVNRRIFIFECSVLGLFLLTNSNRISTVAAESISFE